jgi:CheY-like chemotaxis protein
MNNRLLQGCRILVVEDEAMIAYDLSSSLQEAGAEVLGPRHTVESALDLLREEQDVHGAVLDVNLGGAMVFPVADALALRGVPFIFATGYPRAVLPSRYNSVKRYEKPVNMTDVTEAIGDAMFAFLAPGSRRQRITMPPE